jgi:lipopolysaccharide transport system permease protein
MGAEATEHWDLTVSSKHRLFDLKLRELIRYRDLVYMLFLRDFTTAYKQTILGPLWHIVNPLFSTVVFTFVFGNLAAVSTGGIPHLLFYYGGTMLWGYFSVCLNTTAGIFAANANIFSKVYFPRLAAVIAAIFSALLKLFIQFAMLMVFFVYYLSRGAEIHPSPLVCLFPIALIWLGALGTGFGMVVSALTTKYRDMTHLLALALQLAMYVTPIVYPLSQVPQKYMFFFYINPVSAPVELFRIWFYGIGEVPYQMVISSIGTTALILVLGLALFSRTERTFVDVI